MKKNNKKNRMMAYAIIALVAIVIFGPMVACMKDNYSAEKEAALVNNNTIEQSETTTEKNDQASCEEKVAEVKAQYEEKLRALEAEKEAIKAEFEASKEQEVSPFEQWPYSEIEFDSNGKVVRVKSMEAVEALITIQKNDNTAVYRLGDGNKCEVTEEVNVKTKKYWDNEFDLAHKWGIIVGKTANGELRYINAGRVNSNNEFYSYNWGNGCKATEGYAYQVTDKMGTYGDLPSSFRTALRWYEDESSPVGVTFCLDYTENVYVAAAKPVTQPEKPVVKPTTKPVERPEVDDDDDYEEDSPINKPENNTQNPGKDDLIDSIVNGKQENNSTNNGFKDLAAELKNLIPEVEWKPESNTNNGNSSSNDEWAPNNSSSSENNEQSNKNDDTWLPSNSVENNSSNNNSSTSNNGWEPNTVSVVVESAVNTTVNEENATTNNGFEALRNSLS